eukprot:CAMPEP_0172554942 /NCGR_PEP_ID=MMETSP1067-20121228/57178_1 /TAXON_ID=265564 ORGANISM="Thalassiosira punctigera, Strain Tpunct2005C2" /NCGR_SAMPLE_ID=MMETSP1067 /ASSEMBLY_ACC=CAM_ASM_000444 /LENGTH=306 /DNA_ID=CAMNT_0013343423 /DNA_START=24 /DNA_END=944 /DNA_ORIENTATION=+
MIRSNLFARRIAAAFAPKNASPCAVSPASPVIDALVNNSHCASYTTSAAIHHFSTPLAAHPASRHFSSSDTATELGSILQREIEEETEAAAEYDGNLPPDLAELDAEIRQKWTVVEGISGIGSVGGGETGSGATMRMFRKEPGSKGAKIGVVFHCQDTEEDVRFDAEQELATYRDDEEAGGDGGEEEEPAQAVRFGVTVSKGGKTVVLQCRSDGDGHVNVESVVVRDGDAESVLAALAGGEGTHAALYQGPEFTELAEDLQESFSRYVAKECGIDENVAAYIIMYSDYREQEEYLSWMKTTIDILD